MATIHNLGFPRIGGERELKKALESFWKSESTAEELLQVGAKVREANRSHQKALDLLPVNDFSNYDQVLDTSILLGNIPAHYAAHEGTELDTYFRMARGRSAGESGGTCHAQEMTKWFDTNYHYMVPEFTAESSFTPNPAKLISEIREAKSAGAAVKPVLVGPITYLKLGKEKDGSDRLNLLGKIIPAYAEILRAAAAEGVQWVQIDEPILATDLDEKWQSAVKTAYSALAQVNVNLLFTTYFGELRENLDLALSLPVAGIHIDAIRGSKEIDRVVKGIKENQVLSLGVVDGRNIWKSDLNAVLDWVEPIAEELKDRLWIAPSCSLLHVPVNLDSEVNIDSEAREWLAFAVQKIREIEVLGKALNSGRESVAAELAANRKSRESREGSARVHHNEVKAAVTAIDPAMGSRISSYKERAKIQREKLNLPLYPTTTIGSFPQTREIRSARLKFKRGELSQDMYETFMQSEIARSVRFQEDLGIDVLVHGEAERNDMVEYFGQQLQGYLFSQFGWVQSYGSRCVKPPIIFGDISRPNPMTLEWISYAQSITEKPMKGMLTGPVTILNWSFVRDDQPRSETCYQLALAIREEVLDLERAGISIIQIDEAALREGLPLRKSDWKEYLRWSVECFRITANGVKDDTQIHTHMCYSEFNDIIEAIADMDADVITIETSRSQMELLEAFDTFHYPNEIGPGVYDIHSPNIPSEDQMVNLMKLAAKRVPAERLWVNPDCGLKTRAWDEVLPALTNMVSAAKKLRVNA